MDDPSSETDLLTLDQASALLQPWERQAYRPPSIESIAQWAEREIHLPRSVSSIPGRLSLELTPFMRAPLDAALDPNVDEIVICSSAQVMKTTVILLIVLWSLANDPWNMLHVMPAEDEALEIKAERYIPIIKASPALSRFLSSKEKGQLAGDCIRLNGATVTFRGSHSPSGLASKPIKLAVADEIDKWDAWTGREADPLDLLQERLKTFYDAKLVCASTPTTDQGRIMSRLRASTNERYHIPCPHCGGFQDLVFGNGQPNTPGIKWPKTASFDDIARNDLAWYECAHCHEKIDEKHKRSMVSAGVWVPAGCRVDDSGSVVGAQPPRSRVGYHIWAGYSPWPKASWSQIASKWLQVHGDEAKRMNFLNSWLGDTYRIVVAELKEDVVRQRAGPYLPNEIPDEAIAVSFGIDVQAQGHSTFHYVVVRAWGPSGKSWLVRCVVTNGWQQVNAICFHTDYRRRDGRGLTLLRPVVDSGFRASEVYDWALSNGALPSKGDSKTRRHMQYSTVPRSIDSADEVELIIFNPDYYKSELHRLIRAEDLWWVPQGTDDEYFSHLVAEQQVRRIDKKTGQIRIEWKLRSDGLPNHYLDAEILALVGADIAEVRHLNVDDEPAPNDSPPPPAPGPVSIESGGASRGAPFLGLGEVRIF